MRVRNTSPTIPGSPTDLASALDPLHQETLASIFALAERGERSDRRKRVARALENLDTLLVDLQENRTPAPPEEWDPTKWRKELQAIIEWYAFPKQNQDRVAIALAYFRDYMCGSKKDDSLEIRFMDLEECRNQVELMIKQREATE